MAGFGDIIVQSKTAVKNRSEVKDVVFPHWIHRIRYKCKVCHEKLFRIEAGMNPTDMKTIVEGKSCGSCHNGKISWTVEKCEQCHSLEPVDWNNSKESRWKSLQNSTWRELQSLMK